LTSESCAWLNLYGPNLLSLLNDGIFNGLQRKRAFPGYSKCHCCHDVRRLASSHWSGAEMSSPGLTCLEPFLQLARLCKCLGLARTIHKRCMYGNFGRGISKRMVIHGAYIRCWPTLQMPDSINQLSRCCSTQQLIAALSKYVWNALHGAHFMGRMTWGMSGGLESCHFLPAMWFRCEVCFWFNVCDFSVRLIQGGPGGTAAPTQAKHECGELYSVFFRDAMISVT
jgi:hypothetical protein